MRTIWQWRNHGDTYWKGLSEERPRQFYMQKEYREIEVEEPRFVYDRNDGRDWPHRFGLIGYSARDSMWRLVVKPVTDWCEENAGDEWLQFSAAISLKDDALALAFRLRWC